MQTSRNGGLHFRAVDIALGPGIVIVELGCGWACWLNNAGTAAKKRNLNVRLIGVEGDEGHCEFAHESLMLNGFNDTEYEIKRGVAGAKAGTALFPRQSKSGTSWGLEPIFGATKEQIDEATASNSCDILPIIPLEDIFSKNERIDLLHIDIQGGELALVEQSITLLNEKVAYLLIGSHSREIEGDLFKVLLSNGWQLEIERPAILIVEKGKSPKVAIDGVQGWNNTRLNQAGVNGLNPIGIKSVWPKTEPVRGLESELAGSKAEIKELKSELRKNKKENEGLKNKAGQLSEYKSSLGYHSANPMRALKLWWNHGKKRP